MSPESRASRLPWWGHTIVLTLIIGGTAISVATGQPLYAVACVVTGWGIGYLIGGPR